MKNVPGGAHVDAAAVDGDGRDRGQAAEPFITCADLLVTLIGKNEINGSGYLFAVDAQQLVRRAVARCRVPRHPKTILDGLKVFLFFVDAVPRPPPPGLMDEGAMRWIHKANDAVVNCGGQLGSEMSGAIAFAELGYFRDTGQS